MSLTSCFFLDLVQHLLVSFSLLYFVFYIWSKLLFVIYFSNCLNCSPSFDSSVFFYFVWKDMHIKEHIFVWTVKSIFGHHEHLWDCDSHKPPNLHLFFSFIYLFWTNDAVVLFSLSTLLSKSPTSCSSLQSIIFPFTCIPTSWYIPMIGYYPINLSWGAV